MPGIVVGVDGSDHSRQALAWAMREAAHHNAPLTVMTVHPNQVRPATQIYWDIPTLPEDSRNVDLLRTAVQEFVDKVANEIGETTSDVTVKVATGDPAEELVKASQGADLLVVGSRGSGAWAQLLLGSVSSKVTHHAASPVVIVKAASEAKPPGPGRG
jgi:nucleotide-binding universal stress UspA family protein